MEDDEDILKIFTVEDLKTSMYNLSCDAVHTDARIVCSDGAVNVHKAHLSIYLPELSQWVPEIAFSFDFLLHLPDLVCEDVQAAVKLIYLDDDPTSLRRMLGLCEVAVEQYQQQQQNQQQQQQLQQHSEEEEKHHMEDFIVYEEVKDGKSFEQVGDVVEEEHDADFGDEEYPLDNNGTAHERLKHQKLFPCPTCRKEFTTPHYLKIHEVKAHDNSVLVSVHRCLSHPSMTFENITRLTAHFNTDHSQKLIRDLVTRGKFDDKKVRRRKSAVDLNQEEAQLLLQDKKPKAHTCSHCSNYSTDNPSVLDNHIALNHIPIQCPLCSKPLTSRRNLRSHMAYLHNAEGSPHVCQECGKAFPTLQSLRKHHDSRHVGLKQFKCDQCPKEYGTKQMLKDHLDSKHTDIKYPCATCGKSFGSKSLLRGHETIHSDFKKFGCEECDKRFRTKEKLRNHQSVHSNVKHPCPVCGSQFSRAETLKVHMKIHDESKALKCSECGKLFDTAQKHKEHMNTHTGVKPFTCAACGAAFSSSSSLCHHRKNCSYIQKTDRIQLPENSTLAQMNQSSIQQHLKTELFYIN